MTPQPEDLVRVPPELARLRRFALDRALYLFDRETGLSALCDGPEVDHLRMRAPRVVQFAITNACNLSCGFCSRDPRVESHWTAETAFDLLAALDRAGTLEVAFGGGEPLVFKDFPSLVARLYRETRLAVSVTTNATRLTGELLAALSPFVAQLRVSIYDDNEPERVAALLRDRPVRWGANYLVTPSRLPGLEAAVLSLVADGCRNVLLLAYNGDDLAMHLSRAESESLATRVSALSAALRGRATIELDVCWGARMKRVPQLIESEGCPAGAEFVVITSDRRLAPCSFHHVSMPFETVDELLALWRSGREAMSVPARALGCARDLEALDRARRSLPVLSTTNSPARRSPR